MAGSENLSPFARSGAVETSSIEPIDPALRHVRWPDLFLIVSNFLINPSTILIGGLAVASGLSVAATIVASTLGILFAFAAYVLMATVGVDYGLTGQVACRMVFGVRGARWIPSVMRTIASTYWFAMTTVVGATVLVAIARQWTGREHSVVLTGLALAAIQVFLALVGYDWLKFLSRFSLPVKIAGIVYLFVVLAHGPGPSYAPGAVLAFHRAGFAAHYALGAVWLNSMASAWLTMITDAADFCRYTRSRRDMWLGTMLASVLAAAFSDSIGAYGAAASLGREPNAFSLAAATDPHWFTLLVVLVVVALDETTINVMNLYTGGLSLTSIFERPGRFWNTLVVGLAATALSAYPALLASLVPFTTVLGNLFAPLAGVLLAHYIGVQRMRIDVPALFSSTGAYSYWHGVNVLAVLWWLLGGLLYAYLPSAAMPAVTTPFVAGAAYLLHARAHFGLHFSGGAAAFNAAEAAEESAL